MPRRRMLARESIRLGLIAGALGCLLAGPSARAGFQFNPNPGGGASPVTAFGLDFASNGNLLLQGAVPALQQFNPNNPNSPVQAFFQVTLAGLQDSAGGGFIPNGLSQVGSGGYQITAVASYKLVPTNVTYYPGPNRDINSATFAMAADQSNSFFRLYANPTPTGSDTAQPLTGQNFARGTLILDAKPFSSGEALNFRVTSPSTTSPLYTGSSAWSGTNTLTFTGGITSRFFVTDANPDYFPSLTNRVLELSGNLNAPFQKSDPSKNFTMMTAPGIVPTTPNVDTMIGGTNGRSGPDILLQADPNAHLVPEPSTLVLTGTGFLALLLAWRRRTP